MKITHFKAVLLVSFPSLILFNLSSCSKPQPPQQPKANEQTKLVQNLNAMTIQFSADISSELNHNTLYSPLSLATTFAILYPGTVGKVHSDIQHYFGFPDTSQPIAALTKTLNQCASSTLISANSIWSDQTLPLSPTYMQKITHLFGASAFQVDFSNAEKAKIQINNWVKNKTRNEINPFIKNATELKNIKLALVNTLYFNGKWQEGFNPKNNATEPFNISEKKSTNVIMMHQTNDYFYTEDKTMKAIKIPYNKGEFNMVLLLPKDKNTLNIIKSNLKKQSINNLFKSASKYSVNLSLPKFEFSKSKDLTQYLKSGELKSAFKDSSDFKNMTDKRIKIYKVIQATKIKVTESGTIASAATRVEAGVTAVGPNENMKYFNANRPFMYLIQQANTGLILFIGEEYNPTEK